MATLTTVIQNEMQRIAKKELKQTVSEIKKEIAPLKKETTALKKKVAALEKQSQKRTPGRKPAATGAKKKTAKKANDGFKMNGKQLKSMRNRLGISQPELAKLTGVSFQIVSVWETKPGKINPRDPKVRQALTELKGKSKADVYDMIGKEMPRMGRKKGK